MNSRLTDVTFALAVAALSISFFSSPAQAQTLDSQLEFYLVGNPSFSGRLCANLGMAVDSNNVVVPGQFGRNLEFFCNYGTYTALGVGFPAGDGTGGSSGAVSGASNAASTASNGGGADGLRARGAEQDAATRRREKFRGNDDASAQQVKDSEVSFGNLSFFTSGDYASEKQKTTSFEGGSTKHTWNFILGTDYRFDKRALLGVAFKYGDTSGDNTAGGSIDAESRAVIVYSSWMPIDGFFVDAAVGVNRESTDTRRNVSLAFSRATVFNGGFSVLYEDAFVPTAITESNTRATQHNAEVRTGYDFSEGNFTYGSRLAAMWRKNEVDAYADSGNTLMALRYDEQEAESLRSLVGMQFSWAQTARSLVWVPQLNVDWAHEYEDPQRYISAYFAEDLRSTPTQLRFQNQAPDRDWGVARLNAIAVFQGGLSAFVAYERTFAHSFLDTYRASLGLRWEM